MRHKKVARKTTSFWTENLARMRMPSVFASAASSSPDQLTFWQALSASEARVGSVQLTTAMKERDFCPSRHDESFFCPRSRSFHGRGSCFEAASFNQLVAPILESWPVTWSGGVGALAEGLGRELTLEADRTRAGLQEWLLQHHVKTEHLGKKRPMMMKRTHLDVRCEQDWSSPRARKAASSKHQISLSEPTAETLGSDSFWPCAAYMEGRRMCYGSS